MDPTFSVPWDGATGEYDEYDRGCQTALSDSSIRLYRSLEPTNHEELSRLVRRRALIQVALRRSCEKSLADPNPLLFGPAVSSSPRSNHSEWLDKICYETQVMVYFGSSSARLAGERAPPKQTRIGVNQDLLQRNL